MKRRLSSSDSSTALITICPSSTEEHSPRKSQEMYGREFQSMLEGLEEEEAGHHQYQSEKKRRLSVDQVKALEKNFEVENKLEPDRKVKLAQELGLQPRQVAVWFQNRRARWKTKQLERDYGVLKANYDALKLNYDTLNHDNQALRNQIKELKSRVQEEKRGSGVWVKEEILTMPAESEEKSKSNSESEEEDHLNLNNKSVGGTSVLQMDGSSDSDSSAILNEDNNNNNNSPISCDLLQPLKLNCSISTMNCFQTQYVKMEEHNLLSADEACNFFSDEQPPTLHWYCPDQWS